MADFDSVSRRFHMPMAASTRGAVRGQAAGIEQDAGVRLANISALLPRRFVAHAADNAP